MCKYLIHYFSGTGNTCHMAETIASVIKSSGHSAELLNIEKAVNVDLNEYDTHIFCFPVYGFGTPSIMLQYISKLRMHKKLKAAVICTSAGAEGQALMHVKGMLEKRGCNVYLTDMIIYTYNWTQFFNPQSKEVEEKVFKAADEKTVEITKKIIGNEKYIKKKNLIVLLLSWVVFLVFNNFGRRILGKIYIADDSCTGCGLCKNSCPSQTIDMHNGKPCWSSRCTSCQRCINICPQRAIQMSVLKLVLFIVFELLPIPILIYINRRVLNMPFAANAVFYIIGFLIGTVFTDWLINILEKLPGLNKAFQLSYTKSFRRNFARGFKWN